MINLTKWKEVVYQPNRHRRPYGAFYTRKTKDGVKKVYLAWRFKNEMYRLEPGWAIDIKTLRDIEEYGCDAVGFLVFEHAADALNKMGKPVEIYLTLLRHYQNSAKDHKGEVPQKLLPLHFFTSKLVSHP